MERGAMLTSGAGIGLIIAGVTALLDRMPTMLEAFAFGGFMYAIGLIGVIYLRRYTRSYDLRWRLWIEASDTQTKIETFKPTGAPEAVTAIYRDEKAVSPIIAIILMVAITVLLAAIVFILISDIGSP